MPRRTLQVCFALAIFLSAFLLFQVQPMVSKAILPWFGGTPNVWTTCMLFFQLALFGGYAYAHFLANKCSVRMQHIIHLTLLLAAVFLLRVLPSDAWKPKGDEAPVPMIIGLLLSSIGFSYFLLSATGPLFQRWFSIALPEASVYRLYSLSNIGSLLALLSYPFVIEPMINLDAQATYWAMGFVSFAALAAVCVIGMNFSSADSSKAVTTPTAGNLDTDVDNLSSEFNPGPYLPAETPPTLTERLIWFSLAMLASTMLLAVTNHVCLDSAVIPFLWVTPLALYLITFILCFDSDHWYRPIFYSAPAVMLIFSELTAMSSTKTPLWMQVGIGFAMLFSCCMVFHGELARRKPSAKYLTGFFLTISAGGAAGGLIVALIAPMIFPMYLEMHASMVLACFVSLLVFFRDAAWKFIPEQKTWSLYVAVAVSAILAGSLFHQMMKSFESCRVVTRSFFGVLRVTEEIIGNQRVRGILNGRIRHGLQVIEDDVPEPKSDADTDVVNMYLKKPALEITSKDKDLPTTYYGPTSGVGLAVDFMRKKKGKLKIGAVGLGTGTLAAYPQEGDSIRFYDIDKDVIRLAQEQFSYLADAKKRKANVDVVLGDARLSLEREPDQQFDLLFLDAFSGDAIPAHLLTVEALDVYRRHLKPTGILVVHISNLHYNLHPVVDAIAERVNMHTLAISHSGSKSNSFDYSNTWVLVSQDDSMLKDADLSVAGSDPQKERVLWTDRYSNVFSVMHASSFEMPELPSWLTKWFKKADANKDEKNEDSE